MAGAGFEPAKAEPQRLQRCPFDRSGTPPGALSLTSGVLRSSARGRRASLQRLAALDLVLRILRTTEDDPAAASYRRSRYVPPAAVADMDEDRIASRGVETLDDPIPALIPASCTQRHHETIPIPTRGRLHLNAHQLVPKVSDQVVIGSRQDRYPYGRARADESLHRRKLVGIPLPPRCPSRFHAGIVHLAPDGNHLEIATILLQDYAGRDSRAHISE